MNEDLHLSPAGANLVKAFEGLLKKIGPDQYRAYVCPAGVTTIGWGTTAEFGRKLAKDTVWNKKQCDDAFLNDMKKFEDEVKQLVKVPLEAVAVRCPDVLLLQLWRRESGQEHRC